MLGFTDISSILYSWVMLSYCCVCCLVSGVAMFQQLYNPVQLLTPHIRNITLSVTTLMALKGWQGVWEAVKMVGELWHLEDQQHVNEPQILLLSSPLILILRDGHWTILLLFPIFIRPSLWLIIQMQPFSNKFRPLHLFSLLLVLLMFSMITYFSS